GGHALALHRVPRPANAHQRISDTQGTLGINQDARPSAAVTVEVEPVDAAEVLGDELSLLVPEHAQVSGGHIRVVDDNVLGVPAADAHFRSGKTQTRRHVPAPGEDLDPDHLVHCTAAKKRRPSAMASS